MKSVLAVVAGLVVTIVLSTCVDLPEFGPHWFGIAVVLTALPCAWIGGKLRLVGTEPVAG